MKYDGIDPLKILETVFGMKLEDIDKDIRISEKIYSDFMLHLTEREAFVFTCRVQKNKITYHEIGEKLNLTKQRVSQINMEAIKKLKRISAGRHFLESLGLR